MGTQQAHRGNRVVWQDIKPVRKPKKTKFQKFKISLRSLYKKIKTKFLPIHRKTLILIITICAIVAISISSYMYFTRHNAIIAPKIPVTSLKKAQVLKQGTPGYTTLLPTNKSIDKLGGWTRVSPEGSDPVFAYTDKINNIPIIVSQQPLPSDFKTETSNKIEQLAQNFNANQKITIGSDIVYIGTSIDGPQSIILTKNNLLVLIKSDSKIANDQWANYINSLQ